MKTLGPEPRGMKTMGPESRGTKARRPEARRPEACRPESEAGPSQTSPPDTEHSGGSENQLGVAARKAQQPSYLSRRHVHLYLHPSSSSPDLSRPKKKRPPVSACYLPALSEGAGVE
jgi:hypothetical protein